MLTGLFALTYTQTLAGARYHEAHRKRRNALNKFFSKASITKLEGTIHDISQRLCDILLTRAGMDEPVDLADAYSCFGFDVITSYCFGQEKGLLKENDFSLSFRETIHGGLEVMPVGREWPLICDIVQGLPDSIAMKINPEFVRFGQYLGGIQKDIVSMVSSFKRGETKEVDSRQGILMDMLKSDLQDNEKPVDYLTAEAAVLLTAGTDTVAWTLTVLTYHLLSKPPVLAKVTQELKSVVKDPENLPTWSTLEQLPYLSSVLLESIRLSYGLVARLARIAPDEALAYEGSFAPLGGKPAQQVSYVVPPGSAISILTPIIHHNEDIFPNSHSFVPERWLTPGGARRTDLEKYLLSFSKGSRQCLGMK
jgi:cytochrome P450